MLTRIHLNLVENGAKRKFEVCDEDSRGVDSLPLDYSAEVIHRVEFMPLNFGLSIPDIMQILPDPPEVAL